MENEDVIRQRMEFKREALTEKLETLEDKLIGSVEQATTAVNETVSNVKETVHEGLESVKEAVDVPAHVDRHPWLALGGSILCGYMLGTLLTREKEPPRRWNAPFIAPPVNGGAPAPVAAPMQKPADAGLMASLEPEIRHLKGLALGVALGALREMVSEQVPPRIAEPLGEIIDGVTRKIGGEPLPRSEAEFQPSGGLAARM